MAGDAELIASELGTNALRHTPSGHHGGKVTARISVRPGWALIAITDQGTGRWEQLLGIPGEEEESGRGLTIVAALADKVGHEVGPDGQTTWAEVIWPPAPK